MNEIWLVVGEGNALFLFLTLSFTSIYKLKTFGEDQFCVQKLRNSFVASTLYNLPSCFDSSSD